MGNVPVVRSLAAFLRQIRAGPLRAQQRRLAAHVVARLGDAIGAMTLIQNANVLRVTIDASIADEQLMALLLRGGQRPPDVGRRGMERGGRNEHHDRDRRPEHDESAYQQQSGGHLHANTSSSKAGSKRGPR